MITSIFQLFAHQNITLHANENSKTCVIVANMLRNTFGHFIDVVINEPNPSSEASYVITRLAKKEIPWRHEEAVGTPLQYSDETMVQTVTDKNISAFIQVACGLLWIECPKVVERYGTMENLSVAMLGFMNSGRATDLFGFEAASNAVLAVFENVIVNDYVHNAEHINPKAFIFVFPDDDDKVIFKRCLDNAYAATKHPTLAALIQRYDERVYMPAWAGEEIKVNNDKTTNPTTTIRQIFDKPKYKIAFMPSQFDNGEHMSTAQMVLKALAKHVDCEFFKSPVDDALKDMDLCILDRPIDNAFPGIRAIVNDNSNRGIVLGAFLWECVPIVKTKFETVTDLIGRICISIPSGRISQTDCDNAVEHILRNLLSYVIIAECPNIDMRKVQLSFKDTNDRDQYAAALIISRNNDNSAVIDFLESATNNTTITQGNTNMSLNDNQAANTTKPVESAESQQNYFARVNALNEMVEKRKAVETNIPTTAAAITGVLSECHAMLMEQGIAAFQNPAQNAAEINKIADTLCKVQYLMQRVTDNTFATTSTAEQAVFAQEFDKLVSMREHADLIINKAHPGHQTNVDVVGTLMGCSDQIKQKTMSELAKPYRNAVLIENLICSYIGIKKLATQQAQQTTNQFNTGTAGFGQWSGPYPTGGQHPAGGQYAGGDQQAMNGQIVVLRQQLSAARHENNSLRYQLQCTNSTMQQMQQTLGAAMARLASNVVGQHPTQPGVFGQHPYAAPYFHCNGPMGSMSMGGGSPYAGL